MSALLQLISHEYRKYIFTRGFLLLVMIIPVALVFGYIAGVITDRAFPIRHFIVLDEAGGYEKVIDEALEELALDEELRAWDEYARLAVGPAANGAFPLEAPFAPAPITQERRAAFAAAGGQVAALEAAQPFLLEGLAPPPPARPRYRRMALPETISPDASTDEKITALLPYLNGKETLLSGEDLFAVIVIPAAFAETRETIFWTNNLIAQDLQQFTRRTLTNALRSDAFVNAGVDTRLVDTINELSASVLPVKADRDGAEDSVVSAIRTGMPLVLAYALFVLINSIGGMLLTNTVEEKSNKIVEVLLSSVSATQLMVGKLIGLALVGITLPALILSVLFLVVSGSMSGDMSPEMMELTAGIREGLFGSPLVPLFFLYFLLGYLFYASIYLAVGALSDTIQDAQSFVTPLTILLLLPLPFLQLIVQDPNGLFAQVFTFIPLYTPYAVMLRISAQPPLWEMVAATGLLLFVVTYAMITMGRIYRNGVLSSSSVPSWKQFLRLGRK